MMAVFTDFGIEIALEFFKNSAHHFTAILAVIAPVAVSYTHLRAHETVLDLVCRLLLEKKNDTLNHTSTGVYSSLILHHI